MTNQTLVPSLPQPITAYQVEAMEDPSATQLQQVVQKTYQWTDSQYKKEALAHLQGLHLAAQCDLSTQVTLHTQKIQEFVTRDLVKRTAASMPNHNRYSGFIFALSEYYTWEFSRGYFDHSLRLPGETSHNSWHFCRIASFKQPVPAVALHFLAALTQVGLTKHEFWVAENKPSAYPILVATGSQSKVDPILFAQCGYTFVALADWV